MLIYLVVFVSCSVRHSIIFWAQCCVEHLIRQGIFHVLAVNHGPATNHSRQFATLFLSSKENEVLFTFFCLEFSVMCVS